MQSIILIQMSGFDPAVLEVIAGAAGETFKRSVEIRRRIINDPGYAYDSGRMQYRSPLLLVRLKHIKRELTDKVLGIVDVDLYSPGFDYIYGEADVSSGLATLSLYRLHPEFFGQAPDRALFEERAVKEALHELGHLFGLMHCRNKSCVMRFCPNPEDVDEKTREICPRCRKKIVVGNGK